MLPIGVLAGGLGIRVRHRTGDEGPKALIPIAGRPFIDHKLEELRRAGAERVVMLVGHGAGALRDHVGDGRWAGLDVSYSDDGPQALGTGGAVRHALPMLGDAFHVTYGDTLLEVDVAAVEAALALPGVGGVMTVLRNEGQWESSNTAVAGGRVVRYDKSRRAPALDHIDYGFLAFRATAFDGFGPAAFDLGAVVTSLIERRALATVEVHERFHDIGNEESLVNTERWLESRGQVAP